MDITDAEVIQAVKTIKKYCVKRHNTVKKVFPCYGCLLQPVCDTAMDFIAAEYWPVPKEE